MNPSTIKERAARIRLPLKALAEMAGVDEDNLHRVLKGKTDPRLSTVEKIEAALAREEDRLRAELGLAAGDAA